MLYNVLIVEDDRQTAQTLADQIGMLGHTVVVAYGPRMALHTLSQVVPDVIFMDINMPGVDGVEVIRYLRRDPPTAQVPVIVVSAEEQEATRRAAFSAGANEYLTKPVMLEDLEPALERVMKACPPPAQDNGAVTAHQDAPADRKNAGKQKSA